MKKVALVTGGTRGIGLGISRLLADAGYDLAICGVRDEKDVSVPLGGLRDLGREVCYCRADIGNSKARNYLIESIRTRFGQLDVLVNNAGIAPPVRADILDATEESFEQVLRVNLQGPYFLTQAVARWMIDQKKTSLGFTGCIVNVSSISSGVPSVNRGDYCVSKAGITMATKLWTVRLAEYGIRVYEVQPGIIKTDMTAGVHAKYDKLISEGRLLEPRWGTPEDVARTVAMLVRGDLPYSSGQVIVVDGGLTIPRL